MLPPIIIIPPLPCCCCCCCCCEGIVLFVSSAYSDVLGGSSECDGALTRVLPCSQSVCCLSGMIVVTEGPG
uniref:Putative secreted protein n=1 Tax=Anopheles darlingi TaxID=43151 RepID=A0A2M4D3X9_ANODA